MTALCAGTASDVHLPTAGADNSSLPGMGGVFNTTNCHLYHYAGNNSVRYVDPEGRELVINGTWEYKKSVERYLQLIAPGAHVNMWTGKVSLDKNASLGGHIKGTALVNSLVDDKHKITVTKNDYERPTSTPKNERDTYVSGKGSDSTIHFNPNDKVKAIVVIRDRGKAKAREYIQNPGIVLGHELIHSLHFALGIRASGSVESYTDLMGRTVGGGTRVEELKTIGIPGYFDEDTDITENMLREELFMYLRNEHEGFSD